MPPAQASAIAEARLLHEIARSASLGSGIPNNLRAMLFSAFLDIAFEHHDSIVLLLETGRNDASSFALLRSLPECFFRGLWMFLCGSDSQLEALASGTFRFTKSFSAIKEEVIAAVNNTGKLRLNANLWDALNGFTHTGSEQISRRFNAEGDLMPSYKLEEVLEVLRIATNTLGIMAYFFCRLVSKEESNARVVLNHLSILLNEDCCPIAPKD